MTTTLAEMLTPAAVDVATLRRRYGTQLALVRTLIGVVPNCDAYLEIWPAAFRNYNVMVPNFLNLPLVLWGVGAPKTTLGLVLYAASRASQCMYCSAHCCAFALRRGASDEAVAAATDANASVHGPRERAAIAVAEALGRVPSTLDEAHRGELLRRFSRAEAEWLVLGAAMMGFLNKFMDALGVELELPTVEEVRPVIGATGWSNGKHRVARAAESSPPRRGDGLGITLRVLRYAPTAVAQDKRWTAGVPSTWPAVGSYLRDRTGSDFRVLSELRHARAVRAIATMIRDQCEPGDSRVGLDVKHAAGAVFATAVKNAALAAETRAMARRAGAKDLDAAAELGASDVDLDDGAEVARLVRAHGPALVLAKAASSSPARVTPAVIDHARELEPAAIVEIVSWLSVLQMLHRLTTFYAA